MYYPVWSVCIWPHINLIYTLTQSTDLVSLFFWMLLLLLDQGDGWWDDVKRDNIKDSDRYNAILQ